MKGRAGLSSARRSAKACTPAGAVGTPRPTSFRVDSVAALRVETRTVRPRRISLLATFLIVASCHWANAQPSITDPADLSVSLGATARFTVTATPTAPPMTYEWWFKDAKLDALANPSAATRQLSLTNVTLANAGPYFVIVSDLSGSATSQPATLTVDPTFTKITQGALVNDRLESWGGLWGDYDSDGRLDVLVTGPMNQWRLYHNDGSAMFSPVTSGVMSQRSLHGIWGAWGDPNNDGALDFYAGPTWSSSESPWMYWNDGHGNFVRQPVGPTWTSNHIRLRGTLSTWGDFDRDGFLDAFLDATFSANTGSTITNALLHNNGDGTFAVVTDSVLNIENDGIQYTCAVDYDNDGSLDLVPVRWTGPLPTQFYHNDGHGVFTEATPEPIRSEVNYSLGAAWADFDTDGDLDVIFGGWFTWENFYVNNGDGTFSPWSGQPEHLEFDDQHTGFEAWGDFDNGGFLDVFAAVGLPGLGLWRNLGNGNFEDVPCGSPVTDSPVNWQSHCWVDFNNDGFLDLFVANRAGGNYLYMNNGNTNHWLEVKLWGMVSDRLAVGAKIFATATIRGKTMRQLRVITASSVEQTYVSHFGLGDATNVDRLRIEWPIGVVQELTNVVANQILTVTEHQADATNAPSLTATKPANGLLQLRATGQTNLRYAFEASTNLVQWTKVSVRTNLTGTVDFTPPVSSAPQRFYRVQVP